ncbi:MAG: hypothetical protein M3Z09_15530 [Acidobacteriota bacterium]|nr:hypothetical protein [Acidobacteriota bacterium]
MAHPPGRIDTPAFIENDGNALAVAASEREHDGFVCLRAHHAFERPVWRKCRLLDDMLWGPKRLHGGGLTAKFYYLFLRTTAVLS